MKASEVFKQENIGKKYKIDTITEPMGVFEMDKNGGMVCIDGVFMDMHLENLLSAWDIVNADYEEIKQ